ncbi:MAG: glycogen/starch synthase [Candidatus Azobacteroides sp.]|nr:glycogen/starch synthase [Candidatus Azobacteroides sp.]
MIHTENLTPDYVFESSWEVCNKVGGIYTVLSTRAKTLQELLQDKIIFIGPDLQEEKKNPEFVESETILHEWKRQALENESLKVRVGRWDVPGKPIAVLVDFLPFYETKDQIYYQMWEKFGIDSMKGYGDYDEACMFAYAVGRVIESLYQFLQLQNQRVIAHFNEWTVGMGLLYVQDRVPSIATVFTTHATSIGRSICSNNKPLYDLLTRYNGDQMAKELNMEAKHALEKQAAWHADCFTTVSEITGKECSQLLEKTPDIITPNGFESDFVAKGKAFDSKRQIARENLIRVAQQLTGDAISDDAFLVATSGRYEYKNKGIDVFIESIQRVKQTQPQRTILAFLLIPAWTKGPRIDLQERLQQTVPAHAPLPYPYLTHELVEPEKDKVLEYLRYLHFLNQNDDKVKIFFVPSYLNGEDGIFNLSYYDVLIGLDLTIFPSYYEPWGYTPLESIAFHIPTITTNLAGFGIWAKTASSHMPHIKQKEEAIVIERTDNNYFEVAEEIKNAVIRYVEYGSMQISKIRKAAWALSKQADWAHFFQYYLEAYTLAFRSKMLDLKGKENNSLQPNKNVTTNNI